MNKLIRCAVSFLLLAVTVLSVAAVSEPETITASLPEISSPASVLTNTKALVKKSADNTAQSDEKSNLDTFLGTLDLGKSLFAEGLNDVTLFFEEPNEENISRLMGSYTTNAGERKTVWMGVYYNHDTEIVYGTNLRTGLFDSGFNWDVKNETAFTTIDAWQRDFGFTPLFDVIANTTIFDYVTRRIFFDYDGQEFMVQIWKGNYAFNLFVGGEIGVYNRPTGSLGFKYNCVPDEYMLPMSLKISNKDSKKVYVDRAETTWWLTGFNLTRQHVNTRKVLFEGSLTFLDKDMLDAFLGGVKRHRDVSVTVDGLTAYIVW